MPIIDLATYNSYRQFPSSHSVGRNNQLIVLFLSDALRFSEEGKGIAKRVFENIISQSEQIGLLEAIPGSSAMHLFICLRSSISIAQAVDTLREKSEKILLQEIPSFGNLVWSDDYGLQSLGGIDVCVA